MQRQNKKNYRIVKLLKNLMSLTTEEIPDIQTRSHITYKVTKFNRTSEIGAYTGQSVSGEPGVTISSSQ